jgi:hypothetical protein
LELVTVVVTVVINAPFSLYPFPIKPKKVNYNHKPTKMVDLASMIIPTIGAIHGVEKIIKFNLRVTSSCKSSKFHALTLKLLPNAA